ncbi:hypothetical protein RAS1_22820 [Phycisphaerae bacterium RAS1]|nr:hypothetical protein RAS1_22820 [Phycisphaerae bacterium RAS1]
MSTHQPDIDPSAGHQDDDRRASIHRELADREHRVRAGVPFDHDVRRAKAGKLFARVGRGRGGRLVFRARIGLARGWIAAPCCFVRAVYAGDHRCPTQRRTCDRQKKHQIRCCLLPHQSRSISTGRVGATLPGLPRARRQGHRIEIEIRLRSRKNAGYVVWHSAARQWQNGFGLQSRVIQMFDAIALGSADEWRMPSACARPPIAQRNQAAPRQRTSHSLCCCVVAVVATTGSAVSCGLLRFAAENYSKNPRFRKASGDKDLITKPLLCQLSYGGSWLYDDLRRVRENATSVTTTGPRSR